MKRGDEALNASSLQFLSSVKRFIASSLRFFMSVKRFIAVILYGKPSFNASSPLVFKRNSSFNASSPLLFKLTLPTSGCTWRLYQLGWWACCAVTAVLLWYEHTVDWHRHKAGDIRHFFVAFIFDTAEFSVGLKTSYPDIGLVLALTLRFTPISD